MTVIRIRQREGDTEDLQATLSFNEEGDYPITLHHPFSPGQEEQLEWYFEKHLEYPFLDHVKARDAAASVASLRRDPLQVGVCRPRRLCGL